MDANRFDALSRFFADRRLSRRSAVRQGGAGLAATVLGAAGISGVAAQGTPAAGTSAAEAAQGEGSKGEPLELLFVQNASATTLEPKPGQDGIFTLTLSQSDKSTLWFSDKPYRYVGTIPTDRFFHEMASAFKVTPPNAALVVEQPPTQPAANASGAEKRDFAPDVDDVYVVELSNPAFDATSAKVTYDVRILGQDNTTMRFRESPQDAPDTAKDLGSAHVVIDDFICGDHDIVCCNGCNSVADLGEHCFHWSVDDGGCVPCASGHYAPYTQQCNSQYANVCPNNSCFANRETDGCC